MKLALLGLLLALLLGSCSASSHPATSSGDDARAPGVHHVTVDGVDVAYEVRGQGPVCIAHPGGPGFDAGYLHSPALEAHFTMVYLDPIGTGGSGKLPADQKYSIARDVRVLDAVRRTLHLGRACLLGHSYGGFVVLSYAVTYPGRISALILYSTTPTTNDEWSKQVDANLAAMQDQPWFPDAMRGMKAEAEAKSDSDLKAALLQEGPVFFTDWAARHGEYEQVFGATRLSYEVATRREGAPFDVREQLRAVVVPTLIVFGDHDFIGGKVPAGWLKASIQGSVGVMIESAGHFAHLERPETWKHVIDGWAPNVPPSQ